MTDNYEDKYDIANRLIKEHGPLSKATRHLDYALDLLELAQDAFVSGGAMVTIGQFDAVIKQSVPKIRKAMANIEKYSSKDTQRALSVLDST